MRDDINMIKRFKQNTAGRDFAVGDIHGHFTRLQQALDAVGFDPAVDRLFSVGDLVDRGPESEQVIKWLNYPWFHAIRGNHEQMTVDAVRQGETDLHFINGGAWLYGLPSVERDCFAALLADLPLLIEVETAGGLVGIVHADCPRRSWKGLIEAMEAGDAEADHVAALCQWSRKRINDADMSCVEGVRAVVVGHTPLRQPSLLGNVYHIDTGGWLPDGNGFFTLLDLVTLETIPPMPAKLQLNDA